ncbi:MAG: S41 family peptidase [Flavobacteriaceae bacterium]|nr:S41 family peptidase [Flavobacteriaceae bacterium]
MKSSNPLVFAFLFISLIFTNTTYAQKAQEELTTSEKKITIDAISAKLQGTYVFPEVAKAMSSLIHENFKKGNYSSLKKPHDFANQLTTDLVSVSNDKHIRVNYSPRRHTPQNTNKSTPEDSINRINRYINGLKRNNFGFKELKILDGNIGYLDLRSFSDARYGKQIAVSAMNFLSNSDAIIIDLRKNGGGNPNMIQLITSYLYGSEPIHLNTFYWRPTDSYSETWTLPTVEGERSPNTPVYVLTSKRTFSAAEEFSYNLKNLKRATLIGETTGGGAHPGGPVQATEKFTVWVPSGRAINPITETNWEGVGVVPHINTPSDKALEVAQIKAIESLMETTKDTKKIEYYRWELATLKSRINPIVLESTRIKTYLGLYKERRISTENNRLYYQNGSGKKYELLPLSEHVFVLKGRPAFRVKFILEKEEVVELEVYSNNGYSNIIGKTNN